jgi:predicted RecB family nuclease
MGFGKDPMLSKSRFIAGYQCLLRLWNQCYNPQLASQVSSVQQAMFDAGHEVGVLATRIFPGGRLIKEDYLHHAEAVEATREAANDASIPSLFEAAFTYNGVRVRADILERRSDGTWNLIEVKSSTSVKGVYVLDVAVQYYVIHGAGLDIAKAGIMHINKDYVYDGTKLDLKSLFSFSDLTEEVISRQTEISDRLKTLKEMLRAPDGPKITPSRFCTSPYLCEFWEHCTRNMPEFWVVQLNGITKEKLESLETLGVQDIRDIPSSFPLDDIQSRIRSCVIKGEEYLSPELGSELKDVAYPVHFLDFETVAPAIPRYPDTRPYQMIPFQWSDHILQQDGTLEHREYLSDEDIDPREEFARSLVQALGGEGSIFCYTFYEKRVIEELAEHIPRLSGRLRAVLSRFKDFHSLIRRFFYHPHFYGSFSLKSVLPALVPDMKYEDLAIHDGNQASLEYLRMIDSSTPVMEKQEIKRNLKKYCGQDTFAMVKIREELLSRLEGVKGASQDGTISA